MWVSTETIYQSLDVQSRGAPRRDLSRCLRTGRALRRPCRQAGQRKNREHIDAESLTCRQGADLPPANAGDDADTDPPKRQAAVARPNEFPVVPQRSVSGDACLHRSQPRPSDERRLRQATQRGAVAVSGWDDSSSHEALTVGHHITKQRRDSLRM